MKRKLVLILLLIVSLFVTKNVSAMSIGVSNEEIYDGVSFSGEEETLTTHPGASNAIVLHYNPFYGDSEALSSIQIHLSTNDGIIVQGATIDTEEGIDTISGQGNDYTVNVGGSSKTGTVVIALKLPSPNQFSVVSITATAKAYDATGAVLSTEKITVHYNILVPLTSCDDNTNASITTNVGTPQKIGEFIGENYALTTTAASLNITVTPESRKSKIYYAKDGIFSDNNEFLSDGKLNNKGLTYGDNDIEFLITSECSEMWNNIAQRVSGVPLLGISFDEFNSYQKSPNAIVLLVTREDNRSKVNTLSKLSISDVSINYKPDLKTYIATVPNKVKSVKISSSLTDPKSSYVDGFGNRTVNLNNGENEILIKVRAENGAEAVYTIKITREPSDNANLKKLLVNKKEVKLKEDVLLYTVNVENNVTKAEIEAEAEETDAKVEIGEVKDLQEGNNKITITVTSASGKKKVYNVNIVRDKTISENSKLKDLIIKYHLIDFDSYLFEYTIKVSKDEKELDIEAVPESDKASFYIIGNKNLENGSTIKIKVTAEDKKTVTNYIIHIEQEKNKQLLVFVMIGIIIFLVIAAILILLKLKKGKKTYASIEDRKEVVTNEETKPVIEETEVLENTTEKETGEISHE